MCAELRRVYHELPPVWTEDSEILILGSLPSPRSRETGFYYGHPRNRFWKVMAGVFGEAIPETVCEKKDMLNRHRIALWDVIESCLIRGAADTSIKNPIPNDIGGLIERTHISRVITTGSKAYSLYMKLVYPHTGIQAEALPSTSPANCAVSDQELIAMYKRKLRLCHGRPENTEGRCKEEIRAYDLLDELGIDYLRVDHEAAFTIDACEEVDEILGVEMCKNLFLCNSQKTDFYLLMMPGKKAFKTKYLSKQINSSRLSFADEEHMKSLLGLAPGSVTVLGLMNDTEHKVRLLIDKELLASEFTGCHPCINTSSLRIRTSDILEVFLPFTGHEPVVVELPWD